MLRFTPFYQPALWGGRRLHEYFGRALPEGPVGESWELVELPERHSQLADGGRAGARLGDLWRAGDLGGSAAGPFPFLLKWIDARQSLSVQVHPDAAACERLGRGRPKTEAWFVAHADPGASLLIGHHPGLDGAALKQAALGGTMQKWLFEVQPAPGEMFLLDSGTIHAIGGGLVLLEVQEPSDTTFRIFDYGRVGADGKPRALHLEEAAASVNYARHGPPRGRLEEAVGPCFRMRPLAAGQALPPADLRVVAALRAGARLRAGAGGTVALAPGEVIVAEPGDGPLVLVEGEAVALGEP